MGFGRPEAKGFLTLDPSQWNNALNSTQGSTEKWAATVQRAAKAAAVGLAAVTTAAGYVGVTFEKQMSAVQAISKSSAESMRLFEDAARRVGQQTAFTATHAAQAEEELLKAGLKTQEVLQSLDGVVRLAGAGQAELAFTTEMVVAAHRAWQIPISENTRVVNALFQSLVSSRLGMESLNAAIGSGGAVLGVWGVKLEESLATMGALVDILGEGSTAGTYAKNIMTDLNQAIDAQKGVIGNVLATWDPAVDGIIGAVERLEKAGVPARTALEELGMRAGPGLAILMNRGSEALRQLTKDITGSNAAFDAYETMMDNVSGRWAIFVSALQEGALLIYDSMQDKVKNALVDAADTVVESYGSIAEAGKTLGAGLGVVIDVASTLLQMLLIHAKTIPQVVSGLVGMAAGITTVTVAWNILNATAMTALGWMRVAVALLGGIVGASMANVETLDALRLQWAGLQLVVQPTLENIRFFFEQVGLKIEWTIESLKRWAQTFAAVATTNPAQLVEKVSAIWTGFDAARDKAFTESESQHQELLNRIKDATSDHYMALWIEAQKYPIYGPANISEAERQLEHLQKQHAEALKNAENAAAYGGVAGKEATANPEMHRALALAQEEQHQQALLDMKVRYGNTEFINKVNISDLHRQRQVDDFDFSEQLHREYTARAVVFHTAMWASINNAMSKAVSIEAAMHLKLGKIAIQAAREGAAGMIEAKAKVWIADAVGYGWQALAFAALGDFSGAAQMAAASIGLFALGGGAAGVAAALRYGGREKSGSVRFDEGTSGEGEEGGGWGRGSSVDISQRSAPENVYIYQTYHIEGSVFGDGGMQALVERYVVPRMRELIEGNAL